MDRARKERLADEIFRSQPNMLASVLVLHQMTLPMKKMEFALEMLFVCFLAMRASRLAWPLITKDGQGRQMQRLVSSIELGEGLPPRLRDYSVKPLVDAHPEQALAARGWKRMTEWLKSVAPAESDRYVVLAVASLVGCIACVPLANQAGKSAEGR